MAIPRGESGARLDTAAGRAAEAAFQQRKAAEVAQAAMRVAQAEAEAGRAAEAQRAMEAAQAAARNAAPVVQQAVQTHSQQLISGGSGALPVPPPPPPPAPAPGTGGAGGGPGIVNTPGGPQIGTLPPSAPTTPQPPQQTQPPGTPGQPDRELGPIEMPQGGREVTREYAEEVEKRINALLAEGNIDAARLQAKNITGGGPAVRNILGRINTAITAAEGARQRVEDSQRPPRTDPDGPVLTGPGTDEYDYDSDFETRRMREQLAWQERMRQQDENRRVTNVVTTLRGVMGEYGLSGLMGEIEGWVRQGLDGDAVMALVRESDSYNQRFPAMKALRAKNRAISESAYIEFERASAGLERQYGLPAGMLGQDAITRLLSNEVSERELEQRVVMAATAAYQVEAAVKNQFRDFYGVNEGGLTAYFLDPDRSLPLLNKQFVSSQIGAEAARQNIGIGVGLAEDLQLAGIDRDQARQGFGQVARQRGLTAGRGDVVNQQQLIQGNLFDNEQARQEMERAAMSRRGRFEGGGSLQTTQAGVAGLGSSSGM
jgi:hypothetical protein